MTPLTRKENYLNEIVGWGNTAPEKPLTPEELFFAAILGEAVQVPDLSNASRYELFLAKIAGYNVNISPPTYTSPSLEFFLAKAAGMNVTTPTPSTREEVYWSNYTAIVEFEIENTPPLTYKAIEGTLKNYRIYGNTVNGESVGDLITEGEHTGEYSVPVTVTNGTNAETTNIYLPEPIKMVGDEAEYIDYSEQKLHRVRKNLLPNTATSRTINGVTFTVNSDGSVTCNGTARDIVFYVISSEAFSLPAGSYKLNGAPTGGGQNYNFKLDVRVSTNKYYPDTGNGGQLTVLQGEPITLCRIVIYSGYTCNNLTFYPMIRKADIADDTYEPYIADTELDVTLPTLPTLSGTNTLSVGTEVQPSKVYIKGEKEREYT